MRAKYESVFVSERVQLCRTLIDENCQRDVLTGSIRTDSLPLLSPRSTFFPYRYLFEQLL